MTNPLPKRPAATQTNDSFVEQLRSLSRGVTKTLATDVASGVAGDALNSLFGTPQSGDLQPGQPVSLNQQPQAPEPSPSPFPRMNERFPFPFKRKEQFKPMYSPEQVALLRQQEAQVARKIDEIRLELKSLISEIKTVDSDLQKAVDEQIVDPDTYHMNYLDRIKIMLKNILKQLKESRTWMTTQKTRKKQMGYWSQYKKKGTSFGLSHERTVATQVG